VEKPLGADDRRELGPEHLERDLPVVAEVVGEEHRGHPALSQVAVEPVSIGECRGEPFQSRCHRRLRVRSKASWLAGREREDSIRIAIY
jgi:hypothetical protein